MTVSEVILNRLKTEGKTKQWLALKMELSYSTLHQKLTNNTFTAEEFISLCKIFLLDVQNFVENKKNDGLIELMNIPIQSRPDVSIEQMEQYERGGIGIELQHENGSLLYLPYGLQEYLVQHRELLGGVIASYKVAAEQMKKLLTEDEEYESVQQIDNQLVEVEFTDAILNNIIQTLKEN